MLRILLSVGNIVFSLILGALLMAVVAIYSPETLSMMLGWARSFKGLITSTGLNPKYNIWLELLLEERQLLLMFFTVIARIILAILAYPIVLLREEDGQTVARYDWNIRTTRWWMNLLAPLARGIFKSNHDIVMRSGAKGICGLLGGVSGTCAWVEG